MKGAILTLLTLLTFSWPISVATGETTNYDIKLYQNSSGEVVVDRSNDAISQEIGLEIGDVILSIDGIKITSPSIASVMFDEALNSSRSLLIEVIRDSEMKTLWIKRQRHSVHSMTEEKDYEELERSWRDVDDLWSRFIARLELRRLGAIEHLNFKEQSLSDAETLEDLRNQVIGRKQYQYNQSFQEEMIRVSDLACRAIFSMDNAIQICSSYNSDELASNYDRIEKRLKNISNIISSVETHLLKAKKSIGI